MDLDLSELIDKNTMENNRGYKILQDLLNAFNENTETVLALFTPNATVEYPYAKTLGLINQMTMDGYRDHLNNILGQMPDISFTKVKVYESKEQDWYWGEFRGETQVPRTGALYQQEYVVQFQLQNGKFSFYKEYWNVLPVLQALMDREEAHNIINNPLN